MILAEMPTWLNSDTLLTTTAQPSRRPLRARRSAMSTAVPVTEAWMTRKDLAGKGGGSDNAHTMLLGILESVGWIQPARLTARLLCISTLTSLHLLTPLFALLFRTHLHLSNSPSCRRSLPQSARSRARAPAEGRSPMVL